MTSSLLIKHILIIRVWAAVAVVLRPGPTCKTLAVPASGTPIVNYVYSLVPTLVLPYAVVVPARNTYVITMWHTHNIKSTPIPDPAPIAPKSKALNLLLGAGSQCLTVANLVINLTSSEACASKRAPKRCCPRGPDQA